METFFCFSDSSVVSFVPSETEVLADISSDEEEDPPEMEESVDEVKSAQSLPETKELVPKQDQPKTSRKCE